MLTYDYQEVNLSPTKIKRMEQRKEWARLAVDPLKFGMVNIRGFTDIIERKLPDPASPLGFQGVRIGDYLDKKTTITHSCRVNPVHGALPYDNTQTSERQVTVDALIMAVIYKSVVKQTPNATNTLFEDVTESIFASLVMTFLDWETRRSFNSPNVFTMNGDAWPNSSGLGSEYIPPFDFLGKQIRFNHFFGAEYLSPGGPGFYAFRAFVNAPWSQEPFF
ncbi:MAG: hypothetical protein NTY15_10275 [Planctomycetota bacterium]|nr:hypothetical protein [Planctomycetota bacterium]